MIHQLILTVHLILAFAIIGLVLLQHGKGADAGAAFGSGSSGTVFGSRGTGTFLSRTTIIVASLLAVTSVSLTLLANKAARPETLSEKLMKQDTVTAVPVVPSDIPEAPAN